MNHELPDVQAGFRKGRGIRDQIANIRWINDKGSEFQENTYFWFLTLPKPLTVWITIDCRKFLKGWEYQTTLLASLEICRQVKNQQLEPGMKQQNVSNSVKDYVTAVYCHPANLTYMQTTSWEMLDWRNHKLEARLPGEISIIADTQITPPLWQKVKKN